MKGFAVSEGRILKAKKIEAVLENYFNNDIKNLFILDIGAGDGTICDYFSHKNEVYCVDIQDQRINKKSKFIKVESVKLPFGDDFFDIVISNHVIEHIENQELHIHEIFRVLKKNGVCYLATPNSNFPIEPHYKIPLIHYLPKHIFIRVLKSIGKYNEELYLINSNKLIKIVNKYFDSIEYTHLIIENPEKYFINNRLYIKKLPKTVLKILNSISPTRIYILIKKS